MISIPEARQLIEITNVGWKMLNDEEFASIVSIYLKAANRCEEELKEEAPNLNK